MAQTFISLQRKRGISLLEIMVSIGVLSVGLLGILALMPAASNQAKIGAQQDAAAILARRAFREIGVRWDGLPAGDNLYVVDPVGMKLAGLYNANNTWTGFDWNNFAINNGKWFLGGEVSGRRVVSANRLAPGNVTPVLVDDIFRSRDELFFGEFASRENPAPNPPQQVALKDDSGAAVKRFSSGNLSWLVTVVGRNTGFNTVSVAIVNKRSGNEFFAEIVKRTINDVPVLTSGGIGEIQIPLANAPQEDWGNVKSGQWIMLASSQNNLPAVGTAEWYRVLGNGTADLDADGTDDHRVFSVAGADWNPQFVDGPSTAPNNLKTYAILIPNVIAVHSRNLPATQ